MSKNIATILISFALLGCVAFFGSSETLAQNHMEATSEATAKSISQPIVADAPDTAGYTGPVEKMEMTIIPSEEIVIEEPIDWDQFTEGPQADQDEGAVNTRNAGKEWSDFYYVLGAGSTFRPRASSTTWGYPGTGCVNAVSGNDIFTLPLILPQGSRIDYLRLYYYDTSNHNSRAWITTYNGSGGFTDLLNVDSTGNSGYGTTLSTFSGHIVDNFSNSYVLNWQPDQTGGTMRLCGMRVAYRLP
jgi:hypothetical protein